VERYARADRATDDPLKLRDQLRHLRAYLTLLLRPAG